MTGVVLLVTTLYLSLVHLVPLASCVKFIFAIVFFVYLPGYTILKLSEFSNNAISNIFMSLLTGMSIIPLIYSVTRAIDQLWIFSLVPLLCLFYFLNGSKDFTKQILKAIKRHHLEKTWWLGLFILSVILIMLNMSHFNDLVILPGQGYLLRENPTTESIFHLGIINALKDNITPTFPYFSGYNLSYHFDMHIFAELLCRYTGISTLLMAYYFLPLFYFFLIISIPAIFFYQITKNIYFSVLFGFTIFAGDLSFFLNLFEFSADLPYVTSAIAFKAPTWSIFTLNGIMPAIPMLFGAAIMFDAYFKENNNKYLLLLILFITSSFQVKSSMGPHIIGAAITSLIVLYFFKNKKIHEMAIALIISSTIIVYYNMARPLPTKDIRIIEFDFFNGLISTFKKLNIPLDNPLPNQPAFLIFFFTAAFLVYLLGSFGLKLYFIKNLRDFFIKKITQPTIIFLLAFIVSGFILSEIIFIGSKESTINNAGWFAIQSLYVSGFFLIEKLSSLDETAKRRLLTFIVIIFSFSGTIHYLEVRDNNQYIRLTNQQLALSEFVKQNIPIDSIIIEPLQYAPSIISHLSGRTSFASIYITFLAHQALTTDIDERTLVMKNFYDSKYKGNRSEILLKYKIDYILVDKSHREIIKHLNLGDEIFENNEFSLIRV